MIWTNEQVVNVLVIPAVKVVVYVTVMLLMSGVLTYLERRLLGFMQVRKGPNRVGPEGFFQWIADTIKLLAKEDVTPARAEKIVHFLAPLIVVVPALTVFAIIPWGPEFTVPLSWIPGLGLADVRTAVWITDVNVGVLLILAITSIGIYGIILGGWASNSKYALLGGLRSAAQLISYEVPMGLAVASVLLMTGSLSLRQCVEAQQRMHLWFVFPGLLAFFLYLVAGVAETNRTPFDLPEAESELVAGFHTEYSGIKWSFFFAGEYANMVTVASVATTLFLGGWLPPFPNVAWLSFLHLVPPVVWFLLKVGVFLFCYIWLRGTFPRYRFDQLMDLGWKWLIPLALGNIVLVGVAALGPRTESGRHLGLEALGALLVAFAALGYALAFQRRRARASLRKAAA